MSVDYNAYLKYAIPRKNRVIKFPYTLFRYFRYHNSSFLKKDYIVSLGLKFGSPISRKIINDARTEFYKWGVNPSDYFAYRFYRLNNNERRNYIVETPYSMNFDWAFFNNISYSNFFQDKFTFSETFKNFYGREVIRVSSETEFKDFEKFATKHKKIFVKPIDLFQGQGVFPAVISNKNDVMEIWEKIKGLGTCIVDEMVENEESLAEFHPYSLNTLRVNTLLTDSKVKILTVYLNLGNNKSFIDNYHTGAVGAAVDCNTGVVYTPGFDEFNNPYIYHPFSKKKIVGYQLPNWSEFLALINEIPTIVPQIRLVGWDITINKEGKWIVVEGNDNCGFSRYQAVTNRGLQPELEDLINKESK